MRTLRHVVAATLLASGMAVVLHAQRAAASCTAPPAVATGLTEVAPTGFVPIAPIRLADTRTGAGVASAPIEPGCVLRVSMAAADPPGNATAVALTITSDRADRAGFVTAYACGSPRPETSSLNPRPNDPTPNLVVVTLDSTREVCFYSEQQTDLIVDVTGWFTPSGARLHDLTPRRVLDTRTGAIPNGVAPGKVGAGATVRVPVAPEFLPSGATAVAITLTLTQSDSATFATAFPCGSVVPPTSTTNVLAGRDRGAPALVGLGAGALCIFVEQPAHVIVDVTAWYGDDDLAPVATADVGSPLAHLATTRLADSRSGIGWARAPFARGGEERRLDLLGSVPLGTTSVQLSLVATESTESGYLTVAPCGVARPEASAVNYGVSDTETAMVTVALGVAGDVCVFASGATHVIVDLFATYGSAGALHALVSDPPMDQGVRAGQLDHTVHCPAGGGPVTFSFQPAPGVTVSIDGDPARTGDRIVTRTLAVDGSIAVGLGGAVTESHLVRCLPPDFPKLAPTGVSATPGWYASTSLPASGTVGFAFLLDEYGVPVWYKRTPAPVIGIWPLADGTLAWRKWTGGGFPGGAGAPESPPLGYEIHDLTGALVGSVGPVGGTEPLDWHELLELPGGGHLVITYPQRTIAGPPRSCNKVTGGTTTTNVVVDSDLVELDAAGNEVWRWSSRDHTDLTTETQLPICFKVGPGANDFALDYMHLNSAERLADGDYVVSARHFSAVERIDHATGNVEWKLGGTAPTTGTLLAIKDVNGQPAGPGAKPIGPHDARMLANGNVTLHDNHVGGIPRASEYRIDLTAGTATLVWQHLSANPTGSTLGSVRRDAGGATLIAWGEGRSPWLEELDPSGAPVLSIRVSSSETFYRVVKIPAATYTRAALRASAGGSSA